MTEFVDGDFRREAVAAGGRGQVIGGIARAAVHGGIGHGEDQVHVRRGGGEVVRLKDADAQKPLRPAAPKAHIHGGVLEDALRRVVVHAGINGDDFDFVNIKEWAVRGKRFLREERRHRVGRMSVEERLLGRLIAIADDDDVNAIVD